MQRRQTLAYSLGCRDESIWAAESAQNVHGAPSTGGLRYGCHQRREPHVALCKLPRQALPVSSPFRFAHPDKMAANIQTRPRQDSQQSGVKIPIKHPQNPDRARAQDPEKQLLSGCFFTRLLGSPSHCVLIQRIAQRFYFFLVVGLRAGLLRTMGQRASHDVTQAALDADIAAIESRVRDMRTVTAASKEELEKQVGFISRNPSAVACRASIAQRFYFFHSREHHSEGAPF